MKKAFSLIELSIVILIIGILIAGVTQGSRLVKKFRLTTARTLTQSSPVAGIKDLALWYETSMESSFLTAEAQDGLSISTWNDNNPQSVTKYNSLQGTAGSKPTFTEDVFNGGIPAVRFDGGDYLLTDPVYITSRYLTVFVVTKRNTLVAQTSTVNGVAASAIAGGGDYDNDGSFTGFFEGPTGIILQGTRTNNYLSQATHPGNGVPYIAATIYDGTNNTLYLNGVAQTAAASGGNTVPFNLQRIYIAARYVLGAVSTFYNGDIAEVIIFSRNLKTEERKAVEAYLSKKYGIKVS